MASSGGNQVTTGPGAGQDGSSGTGSVDVHTGSATAVGNRDTTVIDQQAITVLTDQATANVTQVVLVFNIGAATADTGLNSATASDAAGSSGSGQITTGSATAVGNAADTYVTQAATAGAQQGTSDASTQRVTTVRLGVSIATSGGNSIAITGQTSGSASVQSGAAQATGNDSTTGVSQAATAVGSDTAQLTIDQRALVFNFGVAIADSGLNQVSGLAGSLAATPDPDVAQQLFAVLLPVLLSSYSTADGTGAITTGDATAVGNKSTTLIDQSATATATGDGSASIHQQVVVANVGAAVASTGGNAIGATQDASSGQLDEATTAVVNQLAAFLANLLAQISAATNGSSDSSHGDLVLPFGDLLINISSQLDANAYSVAGPAGSGPRANIRQVSAVVSLGMSRANTGGNTTISIVTGPMSATNTGTDRAQVVTGNVSAVNHSLVVICQLDDAAGHVCLAPPTPSTPPTDPPTDPPTGGSVVGSEPAVPVTDPTIGSAAPTAQIIGAEPTPEPRSHGQAFASSGPVPQAVGAASGRTLPATGTDSDALVRIALLLLLTGGALQLVRRRATP